MQILTAMHHKCLHVLIWSLAGNICVSLLAYLLAMMPLTVICQLSKFAQIQCALNALKKKRLHITSCID